jgi:hypothetical protein
MDSFARMNRGRVREHGGGAVLCAWIFEITHGGSRKNLRELFSVLGGVTAVALDEHGELRRHATVHDARKQRRRNGEEKDIVTRCQLTDAPAVIAARIFNGTEKGNELIAVPRRHGSRVMDRRFIQLFVPQAQPEKGSVEAVAQLSI